MAKSSKPDKPAKGKTNKPTPPPAPKRKADSERTQPLPKLRKVIDEHFTNWPTDADNPEDGAK